MTDTKNKFTKYDGKKVLIVGMGISGKAALDMMFRTGAELAVYDAKDVEWDDKTLFEKIQNYRIPMYFNGKSVPDKLWDFVVMSPGVSPELPFVKKASARGALLTGDLELAYESGNGLYIGITGTNGKTTTTTLVGEIFQNAGADSVVTGNIGKPVISSALKAGENTWLITEISSFQLETIHSFRPRISAMLNLTRDHLDRHGTMSAYAAAKERIFENQKPDDVFVYNLDDDNVSAMVERCRAEIFPFSRSRTLTKGAFVRDGQIVIADNDPAPAQTSLSNTAKQTEIPLIRADELRIPGVHNLENALAAAAIAHKAGISHKVIAQTLKDFRGVAHRMEFAGNVDGVRYINDSKGTNPDASMKAIAAVDTDILLIAGGYDKHADFSEFIRGFQGKVKQLILFGETAPQIKAVAEFAGLTEITVCRNLDECVIFAREFASPGDTVLLSPACASWDMYANYEERGDHFKRCVASMREEKRG